ncbi:MAG: DUF58 domain-containing protein, partial [Syntrophobacteraceae bacterium]|nr:DUF58 domain-containing protein [Syntrophobacteraceae bacterium]
MIVPQNRLVLFTGFTLLPMSLVAAAAPAALPLLAGAGLAILFVCLFDALHIAGRCGKMRAEFPERVNLVRYRDQTLDFKVSDDNAVISTLYIALALPPEITSPKKEFLVTLPRNSTGLKIVWPVNGVERGEYLVSGCYYRAPSRLGFWCKQGCLEAQTRIRVYPDLLAEQRSISALFLRHGAAGCLARRQVGQGREFEQMRDYLPGDGMADIHWRVTAKRGRLVTKEYQLERTQEIYVLLDASRLSSRH